MTDEAKWICVDCANPCKAVSLKRLSHCRGFKPYNPDKPVHIVGEVFMRHHGKHPMDGHQSTRKLGEAVPEGLRHLRGLLRASGVERGA